MAEHTFNITIDLNEERIVDRVADRIIAMHAPEYDDEGDVIPSTSGRKNIEDRVRQAVMARVREAVDAKLTEVINGRIVEAVDAVLAEGWQKTDSYGTPSGPKMDLKARINEVITKLSGDSYSSNRRALVDEIIANRVEEMFASKAELGKLIDEAKAKLRAVIDSTISAKLTEAMRGALGLPR